MHKNVNMLIFKDYTIINKIYKYLIKINNYY